MPNFNIKSKQHKHRGFSLIELTVALAIFLIVISITVSLLLSTLHQQKRMLAEQELVNQSTYVLEYMSTALKTAIKDKNGTCLGHEGYSYVLTHCLADASQS